MPRGGARPGGGRPRGSKSKATIERELLAAQELQAKAMLPIRALSKDQLAELVPVVKGVVARYQQAAIQSGAPGEPGHKPQLWNALQSWIKTYAMVADLAADFESPRYRAIVVADGTGGVGMPYVVRVPTVMADSAAWQAAVGAKTIEGEAIQAPREGRTEALPHPALPQPPVPEIAPAPAPVVLTADQKTGRISTMMPTGPAVVKPSGSEEWLAAVTAERRKLTG